MEIKSLTSLRGVAAWLVVFYHFREAIEDYLPQIVMRFLGMGYLAVDLFFVLSGFVLFIGYGQRYARSGFPELLDFYGRRLARIYPLHLVILILYLINPIAIKLFSQQKELGERYNFEYYLQSLLLVQNWGFSGSLAWNIPAWSISVEFLVYLIFPFMIPLIFLLARIRDELILVFLALLLFGLASVFSVFEMPSLGSSIEKMGVLRCFFQFFAGGVVGWIYCFHREWLVVRWRLFLFVFLLVLILLGIFGYHDYSFAPVIFMYLVAFLSTENGLVSRVVSKSLFHHLGLLSYSTYLVHYFVRDWVKFLGSGGGLFDFMAYLGLTYIFSFVLYRLVEVPFRQYFYKCWVRLFNLKVTNA